MRSTGSHLFGSASQLTTSSKLFTCTEGVRKQPVVRHNGNQRVRSSFLTDRLFRSVSVSTRLGGPLREDFEAALTEGSGGCQTDDGSVKFKIEKPICAVFFLRRVRRTINVLDQGVWAFRPHARIDKLHAINVMEFFESPLGYRNDYRRGQENINS